MERLYERDQRHKDRLDVLIRLIAAFEDAERQVGERIFELVGEEVKDGDARARVQSDAQSDDAVGLDFGSIGEDVLEGAWSGWDE